ncbi:MAG: winged helix-turn-helix domain-containing protein [candidate division NC10 bacterium]
MVTQRKVLRFIAEGARQGHSISFKDLAERFDLSPEAACDHLKRLWRERLIEAVTHRPDRFHFRLRSGEILRDLRFRLAPRGQDRLEWYSERDKRTSWPWLS